MNLANDLQNKDLDTQLKDEMALGHKAEAAYEGYVKDHVAYTNQRLYQEFLSTSVTETDRILEIKRLQSALRGLEISILNDIETGKMAAKQFNTLYKGE